VITIKENWFTIGSIFGIAIGIFFGVMLNINDYHDDLCIEKFTHAITAADSLIIIQEDNFCLDYSK